MNYHLVEDIYENENDGQMIPIIDGNDAPSVKTLRNGDVLGVLPLRNMVLYPGVLLPVAVSRPKSQKLVINAYEQEKLLAVCCQKAKDTQEPKAEDLYNVGTAAHIVRIMDMPDGSIMVILEGIDRIHVDEFVTTRSNTIKATISVIPDIMPKRGDKHFIALVSNIKDQALKVLKLADNIAPEAGMMLRSIDNPPTLVNYICVNFGMKIADKQKLLESESLESRSMGLLEILNKEVQMLEMKADIQTKAQEEMNKEQREYYLHHQLETIQKELGDTDSQIVKEIEEKAKTKKWPQKVAETFQEELKRLKRTHSQSPEFITQQNYLETILELPWDEYTEDNYDIKNAQKVLDRDHYGMEKVKERVVEYLAVLKQMADQKKADDFKAPILCLYGPPGVGKTSLGKSIATALGRKYARISLGGLHDEAEIRGHRRTYIGAMPGRIIENLKKVQTSNPVFVLDEIDKIGMDYKGDPTSALLEVLDPEQNNTFHDNYLDIDYDLSKVLFIATANSLESIPRPLLDRMELIEMSGYLIEEKEEIAKRYLLPKELKNHGLNASQLKIKKDVIDCIIDNYTRESGVRSLERTIATICRKIVTKLALEETYNVELTKEDIITYLGQPRYTRDAYETNYIGVVTGLAWTQVGGEILFVECSLSPAKSPTLTLTGNLGDVMKESATLALGYIKAHATDFGIKPKEIETTAVHIHVPEGAIPKDGPSAGITITTALVSAFTRRMVRPRIAMTGEMTLRGKVLPIGGVKEKILAAKRAGITDLVLCQENKKDVQEIHAKYLKGLRFHYVRDIKEVIELALIK